MKISKQKESLLNFLFLGIILVGFQCCSGYPQKIKKINHSVYPYGVIEQSVKKVLRVILKTPISRKMDGVGASKVLSYDKNQVPFAILNPSPKYLIKNILEECNATPSFKSKTQIPRYRSSRRTSNNTVPKSPKQTQKHLSAWTLNVYGSQQMASFKKRVYELVNQERKKAKLPPLHRNALLEKSAQRHSDDMNVKNYYDHNSLDGKTPNMRIKESGYLKDHQGYQTAENIAVGQNNPEEVMKGWMNSKGHRKNILNPGLEEIGVGVTKNTNNNLYAGYYWVQNFGQVSK